jgi:hypothetical protein
LKASARGEVDYSREIGFSSLIIEKLQHRGRGSPGVSWNDTSHLADDPEFGPLATTKLEGQAEAELGLTHAAGRANGANGGGIAKRRAWV